MAGEEKKCDECPEGHVMRDGRCVLPEVTFAAFVMSMNTSALFHLGELADPATGEKMVDLVLAKHAIDTLAMIEQKTVGNLEKDEKDLLAEIIYDLKMRYIKAEA